MGIALQLLFTGLGVGSIYALVALGFVLIYRATNVVNFAQGDFAMLGAFSMVVLCVDLARIVHSGFLFRRVPEISVLIRVGESATFGAYHVWREHRECRLAFVA